MEYTVQTGSGSTVYFLSGRFTFADHEKTTEIKNELDRNTNIQCCIFDLKDVEFIDSSGLGSLIVFGKAANNHDAQVVLRKPQEKVLKILMACRYDEKFSIEE